MPRNPPEPTRDSGLEPGRLFRGRLGASSPSSSGSRRGGGGGGASCGRFAAPGPSFFAGRSCAGRSSANAEGRGRLGGARVRARHPGTGPGAGVRCSHGPDGVVEVVTAVVGATAPPAARPADTLPDRSEAADCPNLPQRPRPSRNAREETLIFRAFLRGQSRPGAPLWQIWTHPRPGSPQEPHPPHADTPRITFLGAEGGWLLSPRTNPAAASRRSRSRPPPS